LLNGVGVEAKVAEGKGKDFGGQTGRHPLKHLAVVYVIHDPGNQVVVRRRIRKEVVLLIPEVFRARTAEHIANVC
jgi:hypothetical protein